MKRLLITGALLGLASMGLAERAGVAESRNSFSIQRSETTLTQRANSLSEVQAGDIVKAQGAPVRIEGHGMSVLVSEQGTLLAAEKGFALNEGAAAVSFEAKSLGTLNFAELTVTALESETPSLLVASVVSPAEVTLESVTGTYAMKAGEQQVGILGMADQLRLVRTENGWVAMAKSEGAPGFNAQADADLGGAEGSGDGQDKKLGGLLIPVGIGAAVVGGGALYVSSSSDSKSGDDENRGDGPVRPPASPPR